MLNVFEFQLTAFFFIFRIDPYRGNRDLKNRTNLWRGRRPQVQVCIINFGCPWLPFWPLILLFPTTNCSKYRFVEMTVYFLIVSFLNVRKKWTETMINTNKCWFIDINPCNSIIALKTDPHRLFTFSLCRKLWRRIHPWKALLVLQGLLNFFYV